jgi:hypothetical protein
MSILYPIAPDSCNGITVDGVELPRTADGGFDVPDIHVPDVVQVVPGLTDVRPDWLPPLAPEGTDVGGSVPAGKKKGA